MRNRLAILRPMAALLLLAGLCVLPTRPAVADDLAAIRQRGVLVVGVKADYPPFGFRSESGEIVGIEPALAADVAKSLGVRLELLPVLASDRIERLQDGQIDLIIATMNDTMERRHQVEIVRPYYYAAGYNVMLPKSLATASWASLKGKTACGVEGAYYNREVETNHQLRVASFSSEALALDALKQERCVGLLFDDASIEGLLLLPEWSDYAMPLESQEVQPWGLAVRKNEPQWAAYLSGLVKKWIRDGTILDLETEYHIRHSRFAEEAHRQAPSAAH